MSLNLLTQAALSLYHLQELAVTLSRGCGGARCARAEGSLGLRGELSQLLELELDLLLVLVLLLSAQRRTAGSLNLRESMELQTEKEREKLYNISYLKYRS